MESVYNESKEELRNNLMNEFLKEKEGIKLIELLENTEIIREKYNELWQKYLRDNLKKRTNIYKIKEVVENDNIYLIITFCSSYIILDIKNNKSVIDSKIIKNILSKDKIFLKYGPYISFEKYNGDIYKLYTFYKENEKYFCINNIIYNKNLKNANACINISLNSEISCLSFQAKNQYLYDFLYFDENGNPYMQDSEAKGYMSKDEVAKKYLSIKEIIVPYDVIPNEVFNLLVPNDKKLIKKF